jgi:hypothetical protein
MRCIGMKRKNKNRNKHIWSNKYDTMYQYLIAFFKRRCKLDFDENNNENRIVPYNSRSSSRRNSENSYKVPKDRYLSYSVRKRRRTFLGQRKKKVGEEPTLEDVSGNIVPTPSSDTATLTTMYGYVANPVSNSRSPPTSCTDDVALPCAESKMNSQRKILPAIVEEANSISKDSGESMSLHCKNIAPALAEDIGITPHPSRFPSGVDEWIPPETHGLENSQRIIPHYYLTSKRLDNRIFEIDYFNIIVDDVRNVRRLNPYQMEYIRQLPDEDKMEIIEEFNSMWDTIHTLVEDGHQENPRGH